MEHNHRKNHQHQRNHTRQSIVINQKTEEAGYDKHAGHRIVDFKRKFYVSLIFTLPILLLSPFIQSLFNISIRFPGDQLILFLLSSFVFFYGGSPFLIGAVKEIRYKALGMMTLISLAISVAYFYSSVVALELPGEVFFWELATLIDIMLLGHWLEMKSIMGVSTALKKLSRLIPDKTHLMKENEVVDVNVSELKKANIILVKPGERIPNDGVVVKGESFVNESMLTGESMPVLKKPGSKVISGSFVEEGSLEIRVEGIGEETYLSKVIKLVKDAQASKSKTQLLADKAAFWLTIIAIIIGVLTFIIWLIFGRDMAFAIERTATVLIIACPHALGLAVPLVVVLSTTLVASNGLLIRNRAAFENTRRITTIVFDKTGTLTEGMLTVKKIYSFNVNYSENEILKLSASLEKNSEHPIVRAVLEEAKKRNIEIAEVAWFQTLKGKGVEGEVEDKKIIIVSPAYAEILGFEIPENLKDIEGTLVFVIVSVVNKNTLAGVINLSDTIRKESYEAVKILKEEGIKVWMITGDNENSARVVAEELGLDGYFWGVLPDEKQTKIKEFQEKGEYVAMVGDGINDAPALAQADVGIAIGSGTDIAAETADIILVNSNPKDITSLILFGKATYKKMVQNLVWATGYNIVAIPLAAGVFASFGILLTPALGAIFMSLSTIIVAINANTLKIKR